MAVLACAYDPYFWYCFLSNASGSRSETPRYETATSVPSLRVIRCVGVTSLLSISDSLTLLCAQLGTCGDCLSFCLLAQY